MQIEEADQNKRRVTEQENDPGSDMGSRSSDSLEFENSQRDKDLGDEDGPYEKHFELQMNRRYTHQEKS
jgi:hypothetical protein